MRATSLPKTWIFFFVIVIILIVAAFLQPSTKSQTKPQPSNIAGQDALPKSREENADSMLKNSDNAIYLKDQLSGQARVEIGYVVLSKSGFVVIREGEQGLPGKIIGHSDLLNGRSDNVSIELSKKLEPDQVYFAEVVADNGDRVFEEENDKPVNDQKNAVVLMSFLSVSQTVSTAP